MSNPVGTYDRWTALGSSGLSSMEWKIPQTIDMESLLAFTVVASVSAAAMALIAALAHSG